MSSSDTREGPRTTVGVLWPVYDRLEALQLQQQAAQKRRMTLSDTIEWLLDYHAEKSSSTPGIIR